MSMSAKGVDGWLEHHSKYFKARWKKIVRGMAKPTSHVLMMNPFAPSALDPSIIKSLQLSPTGMPSCYYFGADTDYVLKILNDSEGLRPFYLLDAASVYAAYCLEVRPGMRVLDMCAAPGGKTFVLACCLFAAQNAAIDETFTEDVELIDTGLAAGRAPPPKFKGLLVSNEFSLPRRMRLQEVVKTHLPEKIANSCVRVVGHDMTNPPASLRVLGPFDRILVDAPCTSDRHQMQDEEQLNDWSLKQVMSNAKRQADLLQVAQSLLAPNGKIVYSTCALSELENDGVIEATLATQQARQNKGSEKKSIFGKVPVLTPQPPAIPPVFPPFSKALFHHLDANRIDEVLQARDDARETLGGSGAGGKFACMIEEEAADEAAAMAAGHDEDQLRTAARDVSTPSGKVLAAHGDVSLEEIKTLLAQRKKLARAQAHLEFAQRNVRKMNKHMFGFKKFVLRDTDEQDFDEVQQKLMVLKVDDEKTRKVNADEDADDEDGDAPDLDVSSAGAKEGRVSSFGDEDEENRLADFDDESEVGEEGATDSADGEDGHQAWALPEGSLPVWDGCFPTKRGLLLVPDQTNNVGPLFVARLEGSNASGHIKVKLL